MANPKQQFTEKVTQAYGRLTPSDRRIADYLVRSYPTGLLENASSIAAALGVNVSTVSRFFPKIGYRSIRSANRELKEGLDFLIASPLARGERQPREAGNGRRCLQEVLHLDLRNLQETFDGVSAADMRRLIRLLSDQRRAVYVFGARKHYSLAYYAFLQLNGVRENVFLAPTGNYLAADVLARLRPRDVVWLFDFRRYPRLGAKVAEHGAQVGAPLVLFTDSSLAPLVRFAELKFIVATRGASWFDSYTAGVSLVNAVLTEYVRSVGSSARERYAVRERLFRHFEIFTSHEELPTPQSGGRNASRRAGLPGGNRTARGGPVGMRRKEES
jgi:DNA-binding MurR/RpiR family transcriptional regulator